MKKIFTVAMSVAMASGIAFAQEDAKLTINPTGRILVDAASYLGGNSGLSDESDADKKFVDGVAIPDLRLGVKASYGKWKGKIDVGFGYGKVGLKDVYVEYDFNQVDLLRGGYFVPQFGLNSETSSSMKPEYEEPSSNEFFNANPRLLALMWLHNKGKFFAATSLFAEAAAMTENATEMGKQAWGASTRVAYRTHDSGSDVVQVGLSLNYSTPNADDHTAFIYSANFPSRVSKVTDLKAEITDAKGLFKLSPELLILKGRFALESQYYFMNVARKHGLDSYQAHGAYGMVRTILFGSDYSYSSSACGMGTPAAKSLELVAGYNWTNANDRKAGIMGGLSNDANVTLNYYINNWMLCRLRYSYTNVRERMVEGLLPSRHVNTIEARLQIIF